MLQRVRAALLQIGLTLDYMGSEINVVRLLLGSPPRIALGPIGTSATAYRDVLRATAEFIRSVYDSRWIRGPKRNAKASGLHAAKNAAGSWCSAVLPF